MRRYSTSTRQPHELPSALPPAKPKHPATAVLAIPAIPTLAARTGHIIPGLTNNLLSLGKLCDADCSVYLDKHELIVHNKMGKQILKGIREQTGAQLWCVNITPPHLPVQNNPPPMPQPAQALPTMPQPLTIAPAPSTALPLLPTVPAPPTTPMASPQSTAHARAYNLPSVPALITYLHAAAGFPVKST